MSKHTPGPWEASHDIDANCVATITSGWVVVSIGADPNKFDAESDARLIAAAPKMLEALEETVYMRGIPDDDEAKNGYEKRLMAAIAKARGETE